MSWFFDTDKLLTIFLSGWCCVVASLSSHTWLFNNKLFFTCNKTKLLDIDQHQHTYLFHGQIFSPGIYSGSQNYWLVLPSACRYKNYEWTLKSESEWEMLFWLVSVWCVMHIGCLRNFILSKDNISWGYRPTKFETPSEILSLIIEKMFEHSILGHIEKVGFYPEL